MPSSEFEEPVNLPLCPQLIKLVVFCSILRLTSKNKCPFSSMLNLAAISFFCLEMILVFS